MIFCGPQVILNLYAQNSVTIRGYHIVTGFF